MIGENGKVIMLVNRNKDTYNRKTDENIVAWYFLYRTLALLQITSLFV